MKKFISVAQASKIKNVPDQTIRDWLENPTIALTKHQGEDGKINIDAVEFMKLFANVIAVFNRKGGVGKTWISILTAMFYASRGQKVLYVDMDPQESGSQILLGYNHKFNLTEFDASIIDSLLDNIDDEDKESMLSYYTKVHEKYILNESVMDEDKETIIAILDENDIKIPTYDSLYDFFCNPKKPLSKIVRQYDEMIDILPSNEMMDDFQNIQVENYETYQVPLSKYFQKYSIVVIDCPPAMNGSRLPLTLADSIIVPFMPKAEIYHSTRKMLEKMIRFLPYCNFKKLKGWSIFCTNVSEQNLKNQRKYLKKIREDAEGNILEDHIPKFIKIEELPDFTKEKKNLFEYQSSVEKHKIKLEGLLTAFEGLDNYVYEVEGVE